MKTISMPTYNRPDCLSTVLESIRAADGYKDWTLIFSSEPDPTVRRLIDKVDFMPVIVSRNPARTENWVNSFLSCNWAMRLGSELNLYTEDDVVISRDALRMCDQWHAANLEGILCLCRWHATQDLGAVDRVTIQTHQGLLGNGFAFRPEHWLRLRKWWFHDDPSVGCVGWDWCVEHGLIQENIPQWRPLVRRSKQIGTIGTHATSGADLNLFGDHYAGNVREFKFSK